MTDCFVLASGTIELYFYDELDEAGRAEARRHLAVCAECRQALDELQVIRAALAARPDVSAPPGGDWSPFMARLGEAIARESPASADASTGRARAMRHYAGYIAMAALLALVTTSVAYVVRYRAALPEDPSGGIPAGSAAAGGAPRPAWTEDAAFASLSEQHFDRAKLVVLGLATRDPHEGGSGEWEYERELAAALLSDTRLYRLAAEERGLTAVAKTMADLELVLLQASMSREPDPDTLQQIQGLIRKRDLLTKMNVVALAGL